MPWDNFNRLGWTDAALVEPWAGFALCWECDGSQRCILEPHPYCKGWCHVCGGAGQWPLDPRTPYFAPAVPTINLEYLASMRAAELAASASRGTSTERTGARSQQDALVSPQRNVESAPRCAPTPLVERGLKFAPTPLVDIDEDSRWFHIGDVRLSKTSARLDIGFPHPIVEATRFESQPFESDARRGSAIVLIAAGKLPDLFVGWLAESEHDKATVWVERLNSEIQARLAKARHDIETGNVSQSLLYHQGSEHAPDALWGGETLELSRSGELAYEQRRSGRLLRTAHGHVGPLRVARLHELLADTSFPAMPQPFFPPGATVCALITDPPFRNMPIEFNSGLTMDGYGEILRDLSELCAALRTSSTAGLERWAFVADRRT